MITSDSTGIFHLKNRHLSYAMQLLQGRFLAHLYWGPPLSVVEPETMLRPHTAPYLASIPLEFGGAADDAGEPAVGSEEGLAAPDASRPPSFSLDLLPQEYPAWGTGEQREGAFRLVYADGTEASRLEYREHEVIAGAVEP